MSEQNKTNRETARRMKIAGHTYQQIGDALGVTKQRAQQYLKITKDENSPNACERCGRIKKVLHCHHLNYETDEFELLCISCHRQAHKLKDGEAKDVVVSVRVDDNDSKELNEAIKRSGLSRTEWVRNSLLSSARRGSVAAQ